MFQGVKLLDMNITATETSKLLIAKICGCKQNHKRVIYSFVDQYHSLCVDKEDILESQLEACENLLVTTKNNEERQIIKKEKEILELCKYL